MGTTHEAMVLKPLCHKEKVGLPTSLRSQRSLVRPQSGTPIVKTPETKAQRWFRGNSPASQGGW